MNLDSDGPEAWLSIFTFSDFILTSANVFRVLGRISTLLLLLLLLLLLMSV
jgi:hypothetical protein